MQYILITGVSSGIGKGTAEFLIKKGYYVLGSVRKAADAKELEEKYPDQFKAFIFDVTDQEAILKAATEIKSLLGDQGLTALINNAGVSVSGPLLHIPIERVEMQLEINVLGVLRVIKAFAPMLGAIKDCPFPPGKIINISSIAGLIGNPFMGPYAASKHALEGMSDCLRRELLIYDVDVILIEPGPIKSDIWAKARKEKWEYDHTDYAYIIKNRQKVIDAAEKGAISNEEVAKVIHKAITLRNPKTRYIVASNKRKMWLAAYVFSDRFYDSLVRKNFKKQDQFRPMS